MSTTSQREIILRRLLSDSSLPGSACSNVLLRLLKPLLAGGVLAWEKMGAGERLVIRNRTAFMEFLSRQFPRIESEVKHLPPRVQGIARFRDSKRLRGTGDEILCVRSWSDDALLHHGHPVGAMDATAKHGVFSFMLGDGSYSLTGRVATVENLTVFTHFERLKTGISLALYTNGRLSNRVLSWLVAQASKGLEVVHVGDYDPTGLDEYRRLRKACKAVTLFLWPNLPHLFDTYGNRSLLRLVKSQQLMQRLRALDDPSLQTVVALMDATNSCLEHEGLLIEQG
jgi:hypothetical protein